MDPALEAAAAADEVLLAGHGVQLQTVSGGGRRPVTENDKLPEWELEANVGRYLHVQISRGGGGRRDHGLLAPSSLYHNSSTATTAGPHPFIGSAVHLLTSAW